MDRNYVGTIETSFGSGSNQWEMSHYQTSFVGGQNGLETTGSVVSGSATLYELTAINRTTGTLFCQVFSLTGGPGPGYIPFASFPVHSASTYSHSWRTGRSVGNGIQLGWSSNHSNFTGSANAGAFYVDFKQ